MTGTVEIDLRELFRVLVKRLWIIILCAVLMGAAVFAYTANFVTPQYKADVTIYVNNNSGKDNSYISSSDLAVALRLVSTYVNIIQSNTVLDKVIAETGLNLSTSQVRKMISAEVVGETEMFKVTVTTHNPQMAADIANAIASVAPGEIAEIIEGSSAKIIDYARVPKGRSAPSYTVNTIIGVFAGAVLAIAVILVQNMLDLRIRNEEELTRICSVPILGVIPDMDQENKNNGKKARG